MRINGLPIFIVIILVVPKMETKAFLGNLLFQTASSLSSPPDDDMGSHISDFRQQPKTDSRADKPDKFPNFDFVDEYLSQLKVKPIRATSNYETSKSQKLMAPQNNDMYSEVIGNIIGAVRERITSVFQQFLSPVRNQQNKQVHEDKQRMISSINNQTPDDVTIRMNENNKNDNQHDGNDGDENQDDVVRNSVIKLNQEHEKRAMTNENGRIMENNEKDGHEDDLKDDGVTTEFFGLSLDDDEEDDGQMKNTNRRLESSIDEYSSSRSNNDNETILGNRVENLANQLRRKKENIQNVVMHVITPLIALWSSMHNQNKNISESDHQTNILENLMETANNSTLSSHLSLLSNHLLQMNGNSKEQAVLAFQHAFNKYARLVINGTNASTGNENENSNTKENNNVNGGDDDDDDVDVDDDDDIDISIDKHGMNRMNLETAEAFAIFILEIFGSIAGLTWGALSQLQYYYYNSSS